MSLNVCIVPDKFKGTLTAHAAADAIARGWRRGRPKDHLTRLPMSDGGDGFGEVISSLLCAKRQTVRTVEAAHRPCRTYWWWQSKTKTAIVESAKVIGLAMLPPRRFHPFQLDTFGLGTVLNSALKKGARRIIIGVGGSATNDGGFGLARALGWRFLTKTDKPILLWINLHKLAKICPPKTAPSGQAVNVIVAVDVQNPLLGPQGATRVYGPQKGLRPQDFKAAERCLRQLVKIHVGSLQLTKTVVGRDRRSGSIATTPGAGAAGGLGFGLMAFAGARPQNGFDLFARLSKLSQRLRTADLVITAEGRIDRSSLMGKGAGEVARLSREMKIPCLGLAGSTDHSRGLTRLFRSVHALTDMTSTETAMAKPALWLERLTCRVASQAKA